MFLSCTFLKTSRLTNIVLKDGIRRFHVQVLSKRIIQRHSPAVRNNTYIDILGRSKTLRFASTGNTEVIPDPPAPPVEEVVQSVGEPAFEALGLGGKSPVGIVQSCLEYLHVTLDIPWWTAIVIGTIVVRSLLFPLVIIAQRNAVRLNNALPAIQKIQVKMTDARERGDRLEAAKCGSDMMELMSAKGVNPLKNAIVPLAQAPLFISFFMGLRGMASLPVESMKYGGILWFTDLTVPDQFYLLPIITSATMALTIEIGTDTAKLNSTMGSMKYVLRVLPIVIFPFIMNFQAGILVYWVSTNFISLCQVAILKIPAVREYFKIDKKIVHDKTTLPIKDKGFVKGMKDSWTNIKLTKELEERQRVDEMNFMRAGRGAVRKTFKFDPTQRLPTNAPIQAKKRDN